jgi:hypothetical protein
MYNVTDEEMDKVRAWLISRGYTIEAEGIHLYVMRDGDVYRCTAHTDESLIPSVRPLAIRLDHAIVDLNGNDI